MARVVIALVVGLLAVGCNLEKSVAGIVRDADEAGVTLNVTRCGVNQSGVAEAIVQIRSDDEEWGTVLFNVSMVNAENVVIGTGSTSVRNVEPGRTYEARVVISFPSQEPPPNPKCEVDLDFASRN